MTEMAQHAPRGFDPDGPTLSVGELARRFDVTVRTLHHYDEIGLLVPGARSPAGYRLYTEQDVTRLQHVVVYRRLGFPLEQIAELLDDPQADVAAHLRRQRQAVMSRLDELRDLVTALDRALERQMAGIKLTKAEQRELFGESFSDDHAQEAEQRWGDTDAYRESQRRAAGYTKEQWRQVKAESDAVNAELVAAMRAGEPATGERAMDSAEQARLQIDKWFYPLPYAMHRGLADLYVQDPRFAKTYEDLAPGLARYVRDAIHANADRAAGAQG